MDKMNKMQEVIKTVHGMDWEPDGSYEGGRKPNGQKAVIEYISIKKVQNNMRQVMDTCNVRIVPSVINYQTYDMEELRSATGTKQVHRASVFMSFRIVDNATNQQLEEFCGCGQGTHDMGKELEMAKSYAYKGAILDFFGVKYALEEDEEDVVKGKAPMSVDARDEIKASPAMQEKAVRTRKKAEPKAETAPVAEQPAQAVAEAVQTNAPTQPTTEPPKTNNTPAQPATTPAAQAQTNVGINAKFIALQREAIGLGVELPKEAIADWKAIKLSYDDKRREDWIKKWEPVIAAKRVG